jgi:hypothetical protein
MKTNVQRDVGVEEVSKEGKVGLWLAIIEHLWVWNGSLQAISTVRHALTSRKKCKTSSIFQPPSEDQEIWNLQNGDDG